MTENNKYKINSKFLENMYLVIFILLISVKGYIYDSLFKVTIIAFSIIIVLYYMLNRIKYVRVNYKYLISIIIFIISILISIIYSIDKPYSISHANYIITEIVISIILLLFAWNIGEKKFSKIFSLAGGLSVIVILLIYPLDPTLRLGYNTIGTNGLGLNLSFCLLSSLYYMKTDEKIKCKIVYYLNTIIIIIGMLMTGSRQAIIFGIGMSVIFTILCKKNFLKILMYSVISIFFVIGFYNVSLKNEMLYTIIGSRVEPIVNKIFYEEEMNKYALSSRDELIKIGIDKIKYKPIIGYGFGAFNSLSIDNDANNSHNNYIELMVGNGAVGTVCFYYFTIYMLFRYLLMKKKSHREIYFICSITLLLIMGLTAILYRYNVNYIFLGVASLYYGKRIEGE